MSESYFAIVNPAAGRGRCGRLAAAALNKLRAAGLHPEVRETRAPGEGVALAREAYAMGFRNFIAVGGDGTSFEVVNGLFPAAASEGRAALGFLPLGTGNSFLRDFTVGGADCAIEAILERRRRPCDVLRLNHAGGSLYFINTLNLGFAADVAVLTNRRLKRLGELGYLVGVLMCLARLRRRPFPLRADSERDARRCLFLAFVRNLPRLFDGSHIRHPLASRRAAARIEFEIGEPVDVVVDGEVLTLEVHSIEVLPSALDVMI